MSVDHAVDIRRIITGLALAAVLLLVLWLRGWPLLFVILLVAALGLWEFYSLFWGPTERIPSRICAIALGYSDFSPAPLPPADDEARILRLG